MRILRSALLGAALLATPACGNDRLDDGGEATVGRPAGGSGDATVRSYALSGFSRVEVAGSDDVVITRGDRFAVTATGPAETLDRLRLRVTGDSLEISRRNGMMQWNGGRSATIRVTMPVLTRLELAGSGDVEAAMLSGENAQVTVAGSGRANVRGIDARSLDLTTAGSGTIVASGRASRVDASTAGSGDIEAAALATERADISVAGSGAVAMRVTGTADVSTVGSGDVSLTGGARCETSRMGSGTVTCR
jgi:Putative auto-transporter adhesin, head GIN domain